MKYRWIQVHCVAAAIAFWMTSSPWCAAQSPEASQESTSGFSFATSAVGSNTSLTGWSSVLDSSIRYDLGDTLGIEVGAPLYVTQTGYDTSARPKVNQAPPLVDNYAALGDTYVIFHLSAPGSFVGYQANFTGTLPTGDTSTAISSGRGTFDITNHLQHTWGFFSPLAEFGVGDSNALINRRVGRPYTTLGMLTHFKAGADFGFRKVFNLQLAGYENLPFGNQKVFSRVPVRSKNGTFVLVNGKKTFHFIYEGKALLEDNGAMVGTTFYARHHVAFFGYYQRSVNQSYNSVTFGVSYTLSKIFGSRGTESWFDDLQ